MAHYLFAQWDGGGSLPPELTVIRQLTDVGHTVTVLGDPVTESEVRAVGVRDFRPWVDAPHHVTRNVEDDYTRDWEVRSPIGVLGNLMDTLMVKPAPLFAAETLAVIDDVRPDAVVASFTLLGSLMAAEARRLPCAALVPNVVSLPAEGMPPFGTGFLPSRGPFGRVRDRVLNAFVDRLWNKGLPELNQARASVGLAPLGRLLEQYERPERVLALTGAAFDFPAALPANVRYVGPQLDDPEWAEPWSRRRTPAVRAGGDEHHLHGPRRAAPARGDCARIPARARAGDHRPGSRPRADREPGRGDRGRAQHRIARCSPTQTCW